MYLILASFLATTVAAATEFGAISDVGNLRKQKLDVFTSASTFFDKVQSVVTPEVTSDLLYDVLADSGDSDRPSRRLNQVDSSPPTPLSKCREYMLRYGNKSNQSHCNCKVYHLREDRKCSMCSFGYYGNECKKCEAVTATFGMQIGVSIVCIYFLFATMYYLYRPEPEVNMNRSNKIKTQASQVAGYMYGASLGHVLINQSQILSIAISGITWSPDLPPELTAVLITFTDVMSFDIPKLISSPECMAELSPFQKWMTSLITPWLFGLLFLLWYAVSRCYFSVKKKYDEAVVHTILQALTSVLLIGMFKTVVKTTFQMFDCNFSDENLLEKYHLKLMMDHRYGCFSNKVLPYQVMAGTVFLLWAVIPFMAIAFQLNLYKKKGTGELEKHMREDARFRITVGWSIKAYRLEQSEKNIKTVADLERTRNVILNGLARKKGLYWGQYSKPHQEYQHGTGKRRSAPVAAFRSATNIVTKLAYLWEVVNAVIKIGMIAGAELMLKQAFVWQMFVITSQIVLVYWVRPYADEIGNDTTIMFCVVQFLALVAKRTTRWERERVINTIPGINTTNTSSMANTSSVSPSPTNVGVPPGITVSGFVQIVFVAATFIALVIVLISFSKAVTAAANAEKKKKLQKQPKNNMTILERTLLLPIFLFAIWPGKKAISLGTKIVMAAEKKIHCLKCGNWVLQLCQASAAETNRRRKEVFSTESFNTFDGNVVMKIRCPKDKHAGSILTVVTQSGNKTNITIPQNIAPGGTFYYPLPMRSSLNIDNDAKHFENVSKFSETSALSKFKESPSGLQKQKRNDTFWNGGEKQERQTTLFKNKNPKVDESPLTIQAARNVGSKTKVVPFANSNGTEVNVEHDHYDHKAPALVEASRLEEVSNPTNFLETEYQSTQEKPTANRKPEGKTEGKTIKYWQVTWEGGMSVRSDAAINSRVIRLIGQDLLFKTVGKKRNKYTKDAKGIRWFHDR